MSRIYFKITQLVVDARRGRSSEKKEAKAVEYDTTFSTVVCINTFLEIESFLFFFNQYFRKEHH